MNPVGDIRPPHLPLTLFRWFCHPDFREEIEGDLVEQFHANVARDGIRQARRRFALDVLLLFRPEIIGRMNLFSIQNTSRMKTMQWIRLSALNLLVVAIILLPFVPGPSIQPVKALSMFGQFAGFFGLVLIPLGIAWAVVELLKLGRKTLPLNNWTKGYYFAIIASAICLPIYLLPSILLIVFENALAGLPLLLFLAYALIRIVPGIKKLKQSDSRSFNPAPLYLLSIPVIALLTRLVLVGPVSDYGRDFAIRQSGALIEAIEKFRAEKGDYPDSIEALQPAYLSRIPKPAVMGIQKFSYEKTGDAYNLYFEQWLHLGATHEVVMYNKNNAHNVKGHFASYDADEPHWKYYWLD